MPILTPDQMVAERIENMARVFTRFNRVISGQDTWCTAAFEPSHRAPAWSDGREVTFNQANIGSISSVEDIIKVTGLNYHELSHIMFTPRKGSWLVNEVMNLNIFQSFNALEDQRIETLLTGMYPATAPYFVATFMSYCLKDESQWETNHVLARGRRYLPKAVREQFEDRFEKPELIQAFNRVIDEYRLLPMTGRENAPSSKKALKLVERYHELLQQLSGSPGDPNGHVGSARAVAAAANGRPRTESEQSEDRDWAIWHEEKREEAEDDDESGDEGAGTEGSSSRSEADGEDSGSSRDSDSDAKRSGRGSSDGSSNSPGSDSGDTTNDSDSSGRGAGNGRGDDVTTKDDLRKMLEQSLRKASNTKEVQEDVKNTQQQIIHGDGQFTARLSRVRYQLAPVRPFAVATASKFGKELERLRADLDPGWNRHQSSGRLNIQRAMMGGDIESVFDQWDPGINDATDIEAVLLLDRSSSMNLNMLETCEAAWVIGRALEAVDANISTLVFNDDSQILTLPGEKLERSEFRVVKSSGGTRPRRGTFEAARILHSSRRKHKVCIFLTDGSWWSAEDTFKTIDRMNDNNVVTALVDLGSSSGPMPKSATNHCSMGYYIDTPSDLIMFARQIVIEVMKGQER